MKNWFDTELRDGLKYGLVVGAVALAVLLPLRAWLMQPPARQAAQTPPAAAQRPIADLPAAPAPATAPPPLRPRTAEFAGEPASADAKRLAGWVMASADHGNRFFAILDKKNAKVFVFQPDGRLLGATPVLLGYAAGDDSVAGIGQRPIAEVRPEERTTPAGRFMAEPGRNTGNEEVLWVDYEAAVSMHRVRLNNPAERRAERLASPSPKDNRISYGCINMPPAFFETTLWPNFRQRGGIVYVLPEVKSLTQVFPALATS